MIFQLLSSSEVARMARTCRRFNDASTLYFATLRNFHLTHNYTNDQLDVLMRRCPRLEYINAYHSQVDREGFELLSRSLPKLSDLRISEKHQNSRATFQDPDVARLVRRMFVIPPAGGEEVAADPDRVALKDLPLCTGVNELSVYRFTVREALRLGNPPTNLRLLMCTFRLGPGVVPFREEDLARLQKLNLHSCKDFTPAWLELFLGCEQLEELNVHNTGVGDTFLKKAHFPRLKAAHFGSVVASSPPAVAEFVRKHLPHLTALSLVQVGNELIDLIGDVGAALTYLSLEGSPDLPFHKTRLVPFLLRFDRLVRLELTCLRGITSMLCRSAFFRQLEILELSKIPDFQARDTERLLAALPNLRLLSLHLPDLAMIGPLRVTSKSLQALSLRVRSIDALELLDCPKLNSILGKFPESLEASGALHGLRIVGSCLSLRVVVLPSTELNAEGLLWLPLFASMSQNLAQNLIGLDCVYHPALPGLVRAMRVPYVMSFNCTDISFAFFETFCALSEQTLGKPFEILQPGNAFQQTELVRREKIASFRTLTDGRWSTEHFATNVRSFTTLLKDLERRTILNVTPDNHDVYDFLRVGLRKKRFFIVSLTSPANLLDPFE